MSQGWIHLHRQIRDNVIWQCDDSFDCRSAWIDILLSANHADKEILFDGEMVLVKSGQFITSVRKLSERWKWSKDKTLKYLKLLERNKMITRDSNKRRTLISVVNYDKYQYTQDTDKDTERTLNGHRTDTDSPQTRMIKNDKNDKNDKYINNICIYDKRNVDNVDNDYPVSGKLRITN